METRAGVPPGSRNTFSHCGGQVRDSNSRRRSTRVPENTPFRIVAGKLAIAKLGFSSRKHAVSHCGGQARDRETWLHTDACKLDLVFETGWRAVRRREHGGAPGIITSRTRKPAWVLRSEGGNILVRALSDRRLRSCAMPSASAPLWRRGHTAKASACRRAAGVFNW